MLDKNIDLNSINKEKKITLIKFNSMGQPVALHLNNLGVEFSQWAGNEVLKVVGKPFRKRTSYRWNLRSLDTFIIVKGFIEINETAKSLGNGLISLGFCFDLDTFANATSNICKDKILYQNWRNK